MRLFFIIGAPRAAGPQPRDALRLRSAIGAPRAAGPQPRDALRLRTASDPGDEAAGVQDITRIELRLDALHDPAGGAGIVPYGDLRLDRERRPFEIRVAPAGAGHLAPLGEDRGERREIFWNRIGGERAAHDADPRVRRPGAHEAAPARDARA